MIGGVEISSEPEALLPFAAKTPFFDVFGDGTLAVLDLGLACCTIESEVAYGPLVKRIEAPDADSQIVIVVSGTVTNVLAPVIQALIATYPSAKVVAFGACASAGGPYWDSYSVTLGIDQLVEVDYYLPGCPPPPEVLREYLESLVPNPGRGGYE